MTRKKCKLAHFKAPLLTAPPCQHQPVRPHGVAHLLSTWEVIHPRENAHLGKFNTRLQQIKDNKATAKPIHKVLRKGESGHLFTPASLLDFTSLNGERKAVRPLPWLVSSVKSLRFCEQEPSENTLLIKAAQSKAWEAFNQTDREQLAVHAGRALIRTCIPVIMQGPFPRKEARMHVALCGANGPPYSPAAAVSCVLLPDLCLPSAQAAPGTASDCSQHPTLRTQDKLWRAPKLARPTSSPQLQVTSSSPGKTTAVPKDTGFCPCVTAGRSTDLTNS